MGYLLDAVAIHVIGAVNRVAFRVSRGRVLPYRFDGTPTARLTEIDEVPQLDPVAVDHLRDGDDYVVLVRATEVASDRVRDLCGAEDVTFEVEDGGSRTAVAVVTDGADGDAEAARLRAGIDAGPTAREVRAEVLPVADGVERRELTARLLSSASLDERYALRSENLLPVARLRPRASGRRRIARLG
ncbi:hypothetical protein AB0L00_43940 [Actinoallomurus sp. NPDC052308]|uniref:hypothetical protein n=1 Tax=Actinoallomurus sp. NPDC052308 TaxID=3155530 RepID=UPI003449386F